MAKLLLWVVVIIAALLVTRMLTHKKAQPVRPSRAPKAAAPKGAEQMVRCAHCGIYLPRSEALMSNDHTWCSLDHAKLGPRH
ncbi:PP0621 family protein [Paenalcaligenes faecalis]|uniref:PP0621 family protein n=1 Tax=Paenalcaligenes faecalis TaxID=2980099 RepID=UPI0022B9A089|nr:PP0621 family protein [Paenalcaligenes faecalis]